MKWAAVVVAAGRGVRFGSPKQFVELAGLPMVGWSLQTFEEMDEIVEIVVATEPEFMARTHALLAKIAPHRAHRVVRGGATRQESAYEALRIVSERCEGVFVHDGARPLVTAQDVRAGMREVRARRASLLAVPVVDTIKQVEPETARVIATHDRSTLWAAQTPQFATVADLRAAHERGRRENLEVTDDAALLERDGVEVVVVPATSENLKVTHPSDVERAQAILQRRAQTAAV